MTQEAPGSTAFLVTDAGAPLTTSGSCAAVTSNEARCDLGVARTNIVMATLGDGNDRFEIATTAVYGNVAGGPGDDVISGACFATGGDGNDTIQLCSHALPGAMYADGGLGDDVLTGGSAGDILHGGGGRDRLSGGPGDDYLSADDGISGLPVDADSFDGGPGSDTVSWQGHAKPLTIDLATQGTAGQAGEGDTIAGVENVIAGSGGDTIVGSHEANRISGREGADRITGAGGNDSIVDGPGADRVDAGPGDDEVNSRDLFADRVACGAGSDLALSERGDRVAAGCERNDVKRMRLNFQKHLNLRRSGRVNVAYNCIEPPDGVPMENVESCPGRVELRFRVHRRWVPAGSASCSRKCIGLFSIHTRRGARTMLRHAGKLPARLTFIRAPGTPLGALPEVDRLPAVASRLR